VRAGRDRAYRLAIMGAALWSISASICVAAPAAPEAMPALIRAPGNPEDVPAWRERLRDWRAASRDHLDYDANLYERPAFAWASRCFAIYFLMVYDEVFYDAERGEYTVEAFLDYVNQEFGGVDAVVLWHAYPRIGFDERNQFDFYRDLPGGIEKLRGVFETFQTHGVRVFINYNPWDTKTRREPRDDVTVLADMAASLNADGIFLDTMTEGAKRFREVLDAARPGIVLESELQLPLARVHDHHMSWAQWFPSAPSGPPGVLRNKWFERRHMMHQIARWDADRTDQIHLAWMNGSGMLIWENVFGSWAGWSGRDTSLVRSMLPIQRRFAAFFTEGEWTPLVPTGHENVYATRWSRGSRHLWTIVNRAPTPVRGFRLAMDALSGKHCFDLVNGVSWAPGQTGEGIIELKELPGRGIAAVLAQEDKAPAGLAAFLEQQRQTHARANFTKTIPPARVAAPEPRSLTRSEKTHASEGMARILPSGISMDVTMRIRECGFYAPRSDISLTFEFAPNGKPIGALHDTLIITGFDSPPTPYAIDETLVTNAEYEAFLEATGYVPADPRHFLRHWEDGRPPGALRDHPVVYVDLDDARAYAAWAGKRLPTEMEWQYAAAGPEQRTWPWGNAWRPDRCNHASGKTTPVRAYPDGRSWAGCYDMCGNVWEWTESVRSDGQIGRAHV